MRILVADTFPDSARAELAERGHECHYEPDLSAADLPGRLADGTDIEALIVRSTRVEAAAVEKAAALRYVIRAGSGTNTIDCAAASRNGVHVCNVPGRNATAVAELAFALLLALDRNIPDNVADLRAGRWNKKGYTKARGIAGRRIGIVGLGNIGLAFAERARAFDAEIYAVAKPDRSARARQRAEAIGVNFVSELAELARTCDVLSLHAPATDTTRHLLDRGLLELLAPEAIVLNTARAELVDEQALLDVMDTKGVRAGIDVFADEPSASTGDIDSPLARHPNTYGTHHIGASTEQAQSAIAAEVVRMVQQFQSGSVPHCVNPDTIRQEEQPGYDEARLASVLPSGGGK